MDSPQSTTAVAEGRRIYMGNLLYSVKPTDVETVLQETGFQYEKIHISIDPISGRNPGYCFVEFPTRDEAERALNTLQGVAVFDRPVKLGPCHPKTNTGTGTSTRTGGAESPRREPRTGNAGTWGSSSASATASASSPSTKPTFQRWGDWSGDRAPASGTASPNEQGPYGALKHLDDMKDGAQTDGKRLYVGGLGKMIDQEQNDAEIRELFAGYDVVAIGKRITPHLSTRTKPGNHHYCFVDFGSQEDAEKAMTATNKSAHDGGFLRVFPAKGKAPGKDDDETTGETAAPAADSPRTFERSSRPRFSARTDSNRSAEATEPSTKPERKPEDKEERHARQQVILQSNNWRRGAPN